MSKSGFAAFLSCGGLPVEIIAVIATRHTKATKLSTLRIKPPYERTLNGAHRGELPQILCLFFGANKRADLGVAAQCVRVISQYAHLGARLKYQIKRSLRGAPKSRKASS